MGKTNFAFENLDVYKRTLKLTTDLCCLAERFPTKYPRLRDQLIGVAVSVPLNIAEGSVRTPKESRNYYKIARGSCFECIPILEIAYNLHLIKDDILPKYKQELSEISKILSSLIKRETLKS